MQSSEIIAELHWLAQRYANRPDIVQGAGGNLSAKVDTDRMVIKASGKEFSDVGLSGENLVPVSYTGLADCLSGPTPSDVSAAAQSYVIQTSAEGTSIRPSMELWFHALLSRFVLHTHSVYVNILSCSHEGPALFQEILQKMEIPASMFPYYNPGFELGQVMAKHSSAGRNLSSVIFLENHGIIVSGDSAQEVADLHDKVEVAIRSFLAIEGSMPGDGELNAQEKAEFNALILFPDQVVYPTLPHIQLAHRYILEQIKKKGLRVKTLTEKHAAAIAGMDAEKYRKEMRNNI